MNLLESYYSTLLEAIANHIRKRWFPYSVADRSFMNRLVIYNNDTTISISLQSNKLAITIYEKHVTTNSFTPTKFTTNIEDPQSINLINKFIDGYNQSNR